MNNSENTLTNEEKKIWLSAKEYAGRYYGECRMAKNALLAWEAGAKSPEAKEYWQKGMYSEEKVKELFKEFRRNFQLYRCIQILDSDFEKWFEQNKKKEE